MNIYTNYNMWPPPYKIRCGMFVILNMFLPKSNMIMDSVPIVLYICMIGIFRIVVFL